ncbi:hypothetical protein CYY_001976 [Polysphondylium violaceum]|uniref:Uncharacterized protein n=1 Tax=Polysphondylium violaceum TaxID=133409 RepID=A0A8J4Q2C3_9MYCE|nr:hypothetical protein CYY_001976 [Polysphondylium violaceum]
MTIVENFKHLSIGQSIGESVGVKDQIQYTPNQNQLISNSHLAVESSQDDNCRAEINKIVYQKKKRCEIL